MAQKKNQQSKTIRKRQVWRVGDVFLLPAADEAPVLGQIIGREPLMMNAVTIALFDERSVHSKDELRHEMLSPESAFAVLFTTPDLLNNGRWRVIDHGDVRIPGRMFPYESLRQARFIGAQMIGSANIESFANAYYGLEAWDDWHDPNYLDGLLLNPEKGPKLKVLKKP